ncbi:MAG: hypothetical protein ACLGHN_10155 [Bacteriovoracia bacterium]
MKCLITLILLTTSVYASQFPSCGPGTMRVWTQSVGFTCMPRIDPQSPIIGGCFGPLPQQNVPFPNFPFISTQQMPWWAYQGNLYYPNLHYPGPWSHPGIQQRYYPGQGQVFAAKPNVYIDSIHAAKKFDFQFISSKKIHFLATTPVLDKTLKWSGKIQDNDKFEVEGVNYDYLFYDVRLPREKMQFENGLCSTREDAIVWMLKDLKEMKYPAIALQDFEEHWRVKIPDYPYYCIYPQYNRELDPILPIEINVEQNTFIRSLYVMVPHKKEPDAEEPQEIPFPIRDPSEFRPGSKIKRENEFREWGVAFLGY